MSVAGPLLFDEGLDVSDREPIPEKWDVFLSYSREDKEIADRVHCRLKQRSLTCFYDRESIEPGKDWADEIYLALQSTTTLVVIVSQSSQKSTMVEYELRTAVFGARPVRSIFPLAISSVDPDSKLYKCISGSQWIDTTADPTDEELNRLVESVVAVVGVKQKVPLVTLESPAGGEAWQPNQTVRLAWKITAAEGMIVQQICMELLENGISIYTFPGKEAPWAGTVRRSDWTVPSGLKPGKYSVRICVVTNLVDVGWCESASPITIREAVIPVLPQVVDAPHSIASPPSPEAPAAASPRESPTLKLLEPVSGAKWTLGRTVLVRVELTAGDGHGLVLHLRQHDRDVRELKTVSELELRERLNPSGNGRSGVIAVAIPDSLSVGQYTLRATLNGGPGEARVEAEIAVESAPPPSHQLSSWEQDECLSKGLQFGLGCAAVLAVIALVRQCQPLLRGVDSNTTLPVLGQHLWEAIGAVLWANALIIPLIAVAGGVLIAMGSMVWLSEVRKWLGGMLMGAAWGGAVGVGLSLLSAAAPMRPLLGVPLAQMSDLYEMGRLKERDRINNILKDDSLFLAALKAVHPDKTDPRDAAATATEPAILNDETIAELSQRLFAPAVPPLTSPKSFAEQLMEDSAKAAMDDPTTNIELEITRRLFQIDSSTEPGKLVTTDAVDEKVKPAITNLPPEEKSGSPLGIVPETTLKPGLSRPSPFDTPISKTLDDLLLAPVNHQDLDWHKKPVTASSSWLLWGALIGSVLGSLESVRAERR